MAETPRVLVVDDSPSIRVQVRAALFPAYEVIEAGDGVDGLAVIGQVRVAMVICDVNMPRMGGLEMVEVLATRPGAPPVVMLTTEGQTALIARARAAGAKGWIVKPFEPKLLRSAVDRITAGAPTHARS